MDSVRTGETGLVYKDQEEGMQSTGACTIGPKVRIRWFLYHLWVLYLYLVPPVVAKVSRSRLGHRLRRRLALFWLKRNLDKEIRGLVEQKDEILQVGRQGYRITIKELGPGRQQLESVAEMGQEGSEVVIGDIDQDGYLLSHVGPLENAPTIPSEQFLARMRHDLKLVVVGGYVGVKKDYRGNRLRFVKEIKNLHRLRLAGCNAPAILDIDVDRLTLTISYILGSVLREELAKRGAALRDRELRQSPEYIRLAKPERESMRIREARSVLHKVVDDRFIDSLFAELSKIHGAGVVGNDVKYGNVIIERRSGQPYWVDFEEPLYDKSWNSLCPGTLRDRDIERFNRFFGTEKLNYNMVKERIETEKARDRDGWKVPVYFGCGLYLGSLWNVEAGYGFWHCLLKHHLPSLSGKRVLDLGGSSAFYALQMLRQGAREAISVEADEESMAQGRFVKAAFEWADNTQYNLKQLQADREDVPAMHLGTFDLAVALSPWLDPAPDSMSSLIGHLSGIADILVLQVNARCGLKARRALLEDAVQVVRNNGFPLVRVIAPLRHGHPLVIARRAS
jgi:tRNA A-37 threonylcarbamoyl transferase component Bud32